MKALRLDKFLADMQIGTRTDVKKMIKKGLVCIDNQTILKPEEKVNPLEQTVTYMGKPIWYEEFVYYMLNKPKGCVTAREDNLHPTVMEFINSQRKDLSPVGRLDLDTEGLLLITNDGALSHELLSPAKHVEKTYEAHIDGPVTHEDIRLFAEGIDIGDDKPAKPARLTILESGDISSIRLIITEGRFHQVKRMFEAIGRKVIYLKRTTMGTLSLDENLKPGEYRRLTDIEIIQLKKGDI